MKASAMLQLPNLGVGIKGLSLSEEEKKGIQKSGVFGIILFKRNIESLSQLFELCREIHSLKPSCLIMIDREGGRVDRLSHLSDYPSWPSPARLVQVCSVQEIEKTMFYMAREIKALGISINFAPCVDVPSVYSPLLEGRLWGRSPESVFEAGLACFRGIRQAGLSACAKHFPGHGGVSEDSHFQLPVDQRDLSALENRDLLPFRKLQTFGLEMIMIAHILYPQVDPVLPASLSPFFLQKLLREKMGFQGLIVSDDLDMKALCETGFSGPEIRARALNAGVDVLLHCEPLNWPEFLETIKASFRQKGDMRGEIRSGGGRIAEFKRKYAHIKPLHSFANLKQAVNDSTVGKWCDTLNKRITQIQK